MTVFVWLNVEKLTNNLHSEGGLVVVASTLEDAKYLAAKKLPDDTGLGKPDRVYSCGFGYKPEVFLFPDAGCC